MALRTTCLKPISWNPPQLELSIDAFLRIEKDPNQKVIHVLDLLRAILSTTFFVDSDAEGSGVICC